MLKLNLGRVKDVPTREVFRQLSNYLANFKPEQVESSGVADIINNINNTIENTYTEEGNILSYGAIGDGVTDDTSAIQNALNTNNVAYIPYSNNKKYLVDTITLTDGQKLIGNGILKKGGGDKFIVCEGNNSIDGVTFESTSNTGSASTEIQLADGASNVSINNCAFMGSLYSAISADVNGVDDSVLTYAVNASDIQITNNFFIGYSRPLYLHSVENVLVANNFFKDTLRDAIRLRQNDGFCNITGNIFENIGFAETLPVERPDSWISTTSYVVDDYVAYVPYGIFKCLNDNTNEQPNLSSNWENIAPSYFETKDAVDTFWSGKELSITNNIVKGTAQIGFDLKGVDPDTDYSSSKVIVSNNQVYDTFGSGISIHGATNEYDVDGNYLYAHSYIVSNNLISGCNTEQYNISNSAILLRHGYSNVTVANNIIRENHSRGITADNLQEGAGIAKDVIITGNQIISNGIEGRTDNVGLVCGAIDSCIISNNIIKNKEGSTIQTAGMSISDNQTLGASTYEVEDSFVLNNNIVKGNAQNDYEEIKINGNPLPELLAKVTTDNSANSANFVSFYQFPFHSGEAKTQAFVDMHNIRFKFKQAGKYGNGCVIKIQTHTAYDNNTVIIPSVNGAIHYYYYLLRLGPNTPMQTIVDDLNNDATFSQYVEAIKLSDTNPATAYADTNLSGGSELPQDALFASQGIGFTSRLIGEKGNDILIDAEDRNGQGVDLPLRVLMPYSGTEGRSINIQFGTDETGVTIQPTVSEVENVLKNALGQGIKTVS